MKQYHDYLKYILENGIKKEDRTGTGTISVFGYQMRFNLKDGFPLVTTKKLHFKSIAYELLWFLSGDTNIKFLNDNGVKIWDQWALKEDYKEPCYDDNDNIICHILKGQKGDLGKIYGHQWITWNTKFNYPTNQISNLIKQIKNNPDSRRLIVSAWNVSDLPDESLSPQENVKNGKMALAPCHVMFQFYVSEGKLSCMLTQRSADSFLGVPYNIASYSLLTHMIAQQCNLEVGEFIWSGGDCHIYNNHIEQVKEQLSREVYDLPKLNFTRKPESIFYYKYEDFEIVDYKAHPHIKGVVAV